MPSFLKKMAYQIKKILSYFKNEIKNLKNRTSGLKKIELNILKQKDLDKKLDSVVSFKNISPEAKNSICMQCHEKGQSRNWMGSTHESAGVSCTNCHYVMTKRSKSKLLKINPRGLL